MLSFKNLLSMKIKKIAFVGISMLSFLGCSKQKKVTRVKTDTIVDISGRWNDADSQTVAKSIAEEILSKPWIENFAVSKQGKKPTVIVGGFINKSSEHIDPDTFIISVEQELVNSQRVNLIQNEIFRQKIRMEKSSQEFISDENRVKIKNELQANYIMFSSISSIEDANEKDKVIYYHVSFRLVDIETNQVVWIGTKKIKKYMSKSRKVKSSQSGTLQD